jgi:elongation factor G
VCSNLHRKSSTLSPSHPPIDPISRIRNIGIIAHIDAGKTTTSERFLLYSGYLKKCGEVHDGNTTMDFMPQERERGITIQSAAISFLWEKNKFKKHDNSSSNSSPSTQTIINLIDTPGHVDFTIEVERSMRVIDGAVALCDGASGVEAQTETVWNQSQRSNVPVIGFVNKMDRAGASYYATAKAISTKLYANPLLLQVPVGEADTFVGSIDLLSRSMIVPDEFEGKEYQEISMIDLYNDFKVKGKKEISLPLFSSKESKEMITFNIEHDLIEPYCAQMENLFEQVANIDDGFAEVYLDALEKKDDRMFGFGLKESMVTEQQMKDAIRNAFQGQIIHRAGRDRNSGGNKSPTIIPLLCGSSYKYKGVIPLLDAVVDYLPSPLDAKPVQGLHFQASGKKLDANVPISPTLTTFKPSINEPLRALAFKVQHHPQKGPLVFFRVYSGILTSKMPLLGLSMSSSSSSLTPSQGNNDQSSTSSNNKHSSVIKQVTDPFNLIRGSALVEAGFGKGDKGHSTQQSHAHSIFPVHLFQERPTKLLQLFASEQREVDAISAGQIGAAAGLKLASTGDTLLLSSGGSLQQIHQSGFELLPTIVSPKPVFTVALSTSSQSDAKALRQSLELLLREDPSLSFTEHADTGQLLLSGMGELHIDISLDRLRNEYNVNVEIDSMQVAYQETISSSSDSSRVFAYTFDKVLGSKRHWVRLGVSLSPILGHSSLFDQDSEYAMDETRVEYLKKATIDGNKVEEDESVQANSNVFAYHLDSSPAMMVGVKEEVASAYKPTIPDGSVQKTVTDVLKQAFDESFGSAFGRGPLLGYPLIGIKVDLHPSECFVSPDTTPVAIRSCISKLLHQAISELSPELLEPIMFVVIVVPDVYTGDICNDVTSVRRGTIREISNASPSVGLDGGNSKNTLINSKSAVQAFIPLKEMMGYSTSLRSKTAGEGNFSMEVSICTMICRSVCLILTQHYVAFSCSSLITPLSVQTN